MAKQKNRADCASKRHLSDSVTHGVPVSQMSLAKRSCRPSVSGQAVDPAPNRKQLGGKGMFLQRMKEAGLS
ncbi:hypothetical protein, partial [Endozoicomonas sp. SESOKO4]|uniref:hypothetical protein n=1 Tax=Endozoicomonas sp. SESOKO4 TaxID=2828745 RepID=UPI0021478198